MTKKSKQYIYIAQAFKEDNVCKIGITNDLKRRLKEYNSTTGKSQGNAHEYLFACEVKNMRQVENDIKNEFLRYREKGKREIYFYNEPLFKDYMQFIRGHKMFVEEVFVKPEPKTQVVKIIKRTKGTLHERGMTRIDVLQRARRNDDDEFYTRYEDVEKELSMYDKKIWQDKVVFCNCDDAVDVRDNRNSSAFAIYFLKNFKELGLKKLICTHYAGQMDLFNQGANGYIFTKYGFKEVDFKKETPKGYTGSFDDPLSLKILKEEADIVVTNPPFTRADDYWKVTIGSGKKFIIISNISNPVTSSFIPYFYNNKVWAGYNRVDWYLSPKKELTEAAGHWYTNIPIKNRPSQKRLKIVQLKDIPEKNKFYDDKKMLIILGGYIPNDYKKSFAVSVRPILNGVLEKGYSLVQSKQYYPSLDGKKKFAKILIQKD
jgi:predicted GIY-YIG superfamily endonuclease